MEILRSLRSKASVVCMKKTNNHAEPTQLNAEFKKKKFI